MIARNKDGDLYDTVTGFVYNDDGTVLRCPGPAGQNDGTRCKAHRHESPVSPADVLVVVAAEEA